jgi:imidazolonepropionase-like amidohydrolase
MLEQPGHPGPSYAAWIARVPPTWRRSIAAGTGGLEVKREDEVTYRDSYQRLIEMVGMLHRSGVRLVAGTDGIGGLQLVRELELYVSAGIPPAQALRIATRAGAETMKRADTYGRIAPGYVADLMLVEGDPTINIGDLRKVRTVIRGDRLYDSDALYRAVGISPVSMP